MVDSGPSSSIVMYVCLSKCLSVRLSICLSVWLLVSTQTVAKLYLAESKLIQTRVALLIKNFPAREMLAEMTLFSLSWNTIIYVQTSAIYEKLGFIIKLEFKTNILSNQFLSYLFWNMI